MSFYICLFVCLFLIDCLFVLNVFGGRDGGQEHYFQKQFRFVEKALFGIQTHKCPAFSFAV